MYIAHLDSTLFASISRVIAFDIVQQAASNMLKLIAEGNLDSGGQNKENAEGAD